VKNLPRVFTPWCPAETRTHDLLIATPTLYRNTTSPPRRTLCNIKNFDDVYSIDTLPARLCGLLVCNTQSSKEPGDHWICILVEEDAAVGEFFDSLGRPPNNVLKRYMNTVFEHWTFNSRQLQSVSVLFADIIVFTFAYLDVEV